MMKEISAAFVKAQKAFEPARKTSKNPHFRSNYADLATCVDAVLDALNANGIGLMQNCHPSDTGVVVETVFIHESGERMECGKLHVPAAKQDAQGYGSALTYARRYSLLAACGIAPEDDDGNAASKPKTVNEGGSVRHTPRGGIGEDLAPEIKASLQDLADECTALVKQGQPRKAYDRIKTQRLEADQETWLADQMDAGTRAAIKLAGKNPQLDKVKEAA